MDQGSSPRLPAANLTTKSHSSSESLLISKKIQGFDDSSSVTSMSSTSRSTRCMVCKEEETIVKVLIVCIRCKRKIHPGCANPYIEDYKADWTCPRCKKDKNEIAKKGIASAFSASKVSKPVPAPYKSPYARSDPTPTAPSESPKESKKMFTSCAIAGCNGFISYVPSNARPLCVKHKNEERHASAKAAPPKPAPVSRPFRKDKIYPVRPDDKQLLKRKRPIAKSTDSSTYNAFGHDSQSLFTFQAASDTRSEFTFKAPQTLRSPPVPAATSPMSALKQTPEQKGRQLHFFASAAKSNEEIEQSVDDLNRSLGSASMAESPIEPTASWQANSSRPPSARATPRILAQDSPEYSPPPPPQVVDKINPWAAADNRDNTPGSQIAQELAATASQQDTSETNDLSEFGRAGLPSIVEEVASSRSHGFKYSQRLQPTCEDDDEDMLDANSQAFIDRLASEHPASPSKYAFVAVQSPTSSTYSANASSHEQSEETPSDADPAPEHETEKEFILSDFAPAQNSIEAIRARRAANFDTSELDSFLLKQAQPKSEEQPTAKELLATQIWGHIDPRVAWSKKMTPQEIKEKIKEIEARGGRKANFGKILTAQVRKERADKGWHTHQTSERRSEAECNEMDRRMEELFGREGIANCVPGIRNGRLVMIEQLEPEESQTGLGRRKRRREPKIYPVMGAQ